MAKRFESEHRRNQIVETARNLSRGGRLYDFTLPEVAEAVDLSVPGVRYYFYSATSIRQDVIIRAIAERDVGILCQALAKYDPMMNNLPADLRAECEQRMQSDD